MAEKVLESFQVSLEIIRFLQELCAEFGILSESRNDRPAASLKERIAPLISRSIELRRGSLPSN